MPGVVTDLELEAANALRTVDDLEDALTRAFESAAAVFGTSLVDAIAQITGTDVAVGADTSAIQPAIDETVEAAAPVVDLEADATEVGVAVEDELAGADTEVAIVADATEVGDAVEDELAGADTEVEIIADATAVGDAVEEELAGADTEAVIGADTSGLAGASDQIDEVTAGLIGGAAAADGLAGGLGAAGKAAGLLGVTFGTVQGIGFLRDAAQEAIDLAAATDFARNVFGEAADDIISLSEDAANSFALTDDTVLSLSANLGVLLTGSGQTKDEIAALAEEVLNAGADMSAFRGFAVSAEQAIGALTAGVRGQSRALKPFGITLDETAINAEAAALGYQTVNGEFEEGALRAARLNVILQQLTNQGIRGAFDASDSLAKRQVIANQAWEDAKDDLGEAFAPALVTATEAAADFIEILAKVPDAIEAMNIPSATEVLERFGDLPIFSGDFGIIDLPDFDFGGSDADEAARRLDAVTEARERLNEVFAKGDPVTGGLAPGQADAFLDLVLALQLTGDSADEADMKVRGYVTGITGATSASGVWALTQEELADKTKEAGEEAGTAAGEFEETATTLSLVRDVAGDSTEELDTFTSALEHALDIPINTRDAARDYADAIEDLTEATKEYEGPATVQALLMSDVGEAADRSTEDALAYASAIVTQTGDTEAAAFVIRGHTRQLVENGRQANLSEEDALAYAASLLGIPPDVATTITTEDQLAIIALANLQGQVDTLALGADIPVGVHVNEESLAKLRSDLTGLVLEFSEGSFGLAEGGPFGPGRLHLVGEEGPELVVFDRPGTVIPAQETADLLLNRGGTTVITVNEVAEDPLATAEAVAARLGMAASR